jgi:hypothetical protein
MITMVTAWVLIISLGANSATAVPGLASEAGCAALAEKLRAEWKGLVGPPPMKCFSYQAFK